MKITAGQIQKFREAVLSCNAAACEAFLLKAETFQFGNVPALVAFHDALLLLEAYPSSLDLYDRASSLLRHYEVLTKRFLRANKRAADKLVNSGLRGTEAHGTFTYPLLKALSDHAPASVFLHSFDDNGKSAGAVLRHFLPKIEFEALDAEYTNEELMEVLFGKQDHLAGLLNAMSNGSMRDELRDALFDDLKVYGGIKFNGAIPDRAAARGVVNDIFIHEEILKKIDPEELVNRPLPAASNLTIEQEKKLLLDCKAVLASLNRETDPVTLCAEDGVTYFSLERGVSVALFSMQPERRLPLDSYIGYMLFKNGVPHAYGGAWIYGNRALFGINIFEPFRGGESSHTILQLLRVYRQHFGVAAFSAEPYQYGKDNPEGIQSGAYWFYYKMGFRSDDKRLASLAEKESAKMKKSKSYRSSSSTLKKFTESKITWKIDPVALHPDPADVSRSVTQFLAAHYAGNREECIHDLLKFHGLQRGEIADHFLLTFLHTKKPLVSAEYKALVKQLSALKLTNERQYNFALSSLYALGQ